MHSEDGCLESGLMISVIIPSFNSEETIEACLGSLKNQSYKGRYEIILIDSSIDTTPDIVISRFPDVGFVHLEEKTDPGTARNMGINKAKGDLIAFIDSDCVAAPDWLDRIAEAHCSEYAAVGGVVYNGNLENDRVAWAGYLAEFREFLPGRNKRVVTHIPTCNISYKHKVFDQYGLFNGEYYPQEDLFFNYNLSKNGEKILSDPSIRIYHRHRSKLKDFVRHQMKIGRMTPQLLKITDLEGSSLVKIPLVAAFIIPFLPFIKFSRTVKTFLKYQPQVVVERPFILIIFAIGLLFWIIGFARGILDKKFHNRNGRC